MSGYDLRKDTERSVAYFWAPAKTQIYTTLPKLVDAGYARADKVAQDLRPDKVVYTLTDRGLDELRTWIAQAPLEAGHGRNVILLKLYIADADDAEVLLEQVEDRRADAQRLRDELEELEAAGTEDEQPFHGLTRRFGLLYADALLRWTEEARQALESAPARSGKAS